MLQIDFFDKDLISTLLPVFTMKPDKLYFLIDEREATSNNKNNIVRALKGKLPQLKVRFFKVRIDDIEGIDSCLHGLPLEEEDSICMDFTGGSELMTACGYQFCREKSITPVYVDCHHEVVINIDTKETICSVEHITIDDYLIALGADRLNESHGSISPEDYDRILRMAKYVFQNVRTWKRLQNVLENPFVTYRDQKKAVIPEEYFSDLQHLDLVQMIEQFETEGFWHRTDSGKHSYLFRDEQSMHFMTTFGVWLELYICVQARKAMGNSGFVYIGLMIDWDRADGYDTVDNEIDVLIVRNSVPIVISCKMNRPSSESLYEVGYLAARIGGTNAIPILATTHDLRSEQQGPSSMVQRFEKLHIGLIQVDDFQDTDPKDVFSQVINKLNN